MAKPLAARPLAQCLDADPAMGRLSAHAKRLLALQRSLESAAPTALARNCRIANFKLGVVVIHADNGAVATKLRQIAASLGDEFRKSGSQVTEIRVKVQPRAGHSSTPASAVDNRISEPSKRKLATLAGRLPGDSPLRAALQRLVQRSR
jgi:hypothetical protein